MDYNINSQSWQQDIAKVQQAFLARVYTWMFVGLALTAGVALYISGSEAALELIFSSRMVFFGLIIAQLGIVVFLSARINKMSASTAKLLFIAYSALTGVTMSVVLLAYTGESVASTFGVCALTFGAMSAYGYFTKKDLTGFGSFLMMGLFGIVIASIVNIFLGSSGLGFIISFIGVIVFTGLTAYDTQKMKAMAYVMLENNETAEKGAVIGALQLYLDFINLFLMLLRLMGNRR